MSNSLRLHTALFCLAALLRGAPLAAGELTVLSSNEARGFIEAVAPQFEQATRLRVRVSSGSTPDLEKRMRAGERFDVVVMPMPALVSAARADAQLLQEVRALSGAEMGLAVRTGAAPARPGNAAQMRELLLSARAIAVDRRGVCGEHFLRVLENLGIAEAVAPRLIEHWQNPLTPAGAIVAGRADVAVDTIAAIGLVKGARLAAPLPPEVQCRETIAGALFARSGDPSAARSFLQALRSVRNEPLLRAHGQVPLDAAAWAAQPGMESMAGK